MECCGCCNLKCNNRGIFVCQGVFCINGRLRHTYKKKRYVVITMSEKGSGVVNFLVRALLGMAMIFFINEFLASKGMEIAVGMNLVSFGISGLFGVPGVALLYGIVLY